MKQYTASFLFDPSIYIQSLIFYIFDSMKQDDIIIIGGGAAGFFAAINAKIKNPSLQVTILEQSKDVLNKVKISGGGRCNVTHQCFDGAPQSRCG